MDEANHVLMGNSSRFSYDILTLRLVKLLSKNNIEPFNCHIYIFQSLCYTTSDSNISPQTLSTITQHEPYPDAHPLPPTSANPQVKSHVTSGTGTWANAEVGNGLAPRGLLRVKCGSKNRNHEVFRTETDFGLYCKWSMEHDDVFAYLDLCSALNGVVRLEPLELRW